LAQKNKNYEANTQAKTCIEFNVYIIKLFSTSKSNLKKKNKPLQIQLPVL